MEFSFVRGFEKTAKVSGLKRGLKRGFKKALGVKPTKASKAHNAAVRKAEKKRMGDMVQDAKRNTVALKI